MDVRKTADAHSPFDAAQNRRAFVIGKIVSGVQAKLRKNIADRLLLLFGLLFRFNRKSNRFTISPILDDFGGNLGDIQNLVNQIRRNRVPHHIAILGFARILCKHRAAVFLDALQTHRTVRARPRQNNANRLLVMRLGKRAKENINRRAPLLNRLNRRGDDMPVRHRKTLIRRDDKNVIRLDFDALLHLRHGNLRVRLQNFRQLAFVFGRKMQDNDISRARISANIPEKFFQRLNPARRRADADNEKIFAAVFARRECFRFRFRGFGFFHTSPSTEAQA